MSKLSKGQRDSLPTGQFAGPGRSYPINDAVHARKAIQLAPRGVAAGNISQAQADSIVAKARRKLPRLAGFKPAKP